MILYALIMHDDHYHRSEFVKKKINKKKKDFSTYLP